jgi:hypothetical protein
MINTISKNKIHNLVNIIKENKDLKIILKFCCKRGNSLLHILINEEDIEGFKSIMCIIKEVRKTNKCLVKKIINMQNANGDTPAHIAVRKSKNKNNIYSMMVEALQSVGADFTISNNKNEVIAQSGDPQYNEEDIQKQKYINNCNFDSNNIFLNMVDTSQSDDNVSSEDLDNIETINSPLNYPFPFKLDILTINQKQYPEHHFQENQNQQNEQNFQQIIQEKLEKQLYDQLQQRFKQQKYTSYEGGGKSNVNELSGKRKINNPYVSNGGSKISDKNHNDAIQKIIKLGYSEEEAKDVKNFLYYEIKENYPDLNNDERSEKFAEVLKTFEMMDIKKVRKELEKYRERNNKNTSSKKVIQKESKKEPKKETKKEKKSSKRTSKRSSKRTSKITSKRSSK